MRFEVRGLVRDKIFPEPVILQTLCRSLHCTGADVLLHIGDSVKIDDVIDKMEKVFCNILPSDPVVEQFYSTKQLAESYNIHIICQIHVNMNSKDSIRVIFFLGSQCHGCLHPEPSITAAIP